MAAYSFGASRSSFSRSASVMIAATGLPDCSASARSRSRTSTGGRYAIGGYLWRSGIFGHELVDPADRRRAAVVPASRERAAVSGGAERLDDAVRLSLVCRGDDARSDLDVRHFPVLSLGGSATVAGGIATCQGEDS